MIALLTPKQVMAVLGVSRSTLTNYEKRGVLVPVRLAGLVRYRQADIDRLLDGAA